MKQLVKGTRYRDGHANVALVSHHTCIIIFIVMDYVGVSRRPHEVKFKEAALWSIFYVGVAAALLAH